MQRFAFYYHVGSGNRGCEALVQSTSAMLHRKFSDTHITLYSERAQEDQDSAYPYIDWISESRKNVPVSLSDRIRLKLLRQKSEFDADAFYYGRLVPSIPQESERVFLSIGGDTYCYGENRYMYAFNARLKKLGQKTVLWGCSLDENSFSPHNLSDLRTYDAIFARDTGTYSLLRNKGFCENIFLHPDPAFTLDAEFLPLPEGFQEGNTIGINASPLVFKYAKDDHDVSGLQLYEALIEWILAETDQSVLLVPHVFWAFSDDRQVLEPLYEKYRKSGRVIMLDQQYSASQLKGFIARCRAFVGARTHSTIAAYSSMVPTLVLGYSVKSVNIALDLFGKTDGFVLPIDRIKHETSLADAMRDLLDREQVVRILLQKSVPAYIERAESAVDDLETFMACI